MKTRPVKKKVKVDELRPEYDMEKLLKGAVRGKYVARHRAGTNLVLLDSDVAKIFSNDKAVNDALRLVIELSKVSEQGKHNPVKA